MNYNHKMKQSIKLAQEELIGLKEQGLAQPGDSSKEIYAQIKTAYERLHMHIEKMDNFFLGSIDALNSDIDSSNLSYYHCIRGLLLGAIEDIVSAIRAGIKSGEISRDDAIKLTEELSQNKLSL